MSHQASAYHSLKPNFEEGTIPLHQYQQSHGEPQNHHGPQGYHSGIWSQDPVHDHTPLHQQPLYQEPLNQAPAHRLVHWTLGWYSPTVMLGLFFSATAMAIGHHLYYDSLVGTPVQAVSTQWNLEGLRNSQEWKIRFGSAFGFIVKALYAGAVATAYQEYTWVLVRHNAITVSGLDALFAAGHNFLSFFNAEYLRRAKFGALMALLIWLIPLSALVTPATLTVVPSTISIMQDMGVPTVNFSSIDPLFNYTVSDLDSDVSTTDNGITPYMSRLVTSSSSTFQIMPMTPLTNSTYNLTFHGPSFRCEKPSAFVEEGIYKVLNATVVKGSSFNMTNRTDTHKFAFLAFTPPNVLLEYMRRNSNLSAQETIWMEYVVSCITGVTDFSDAGLVNVQCEGITIPQPILHQDTINSTFVRSLDTSLNYGRLWVWAQNDTYDCVLTDTKYEATFAYSSSDDVQRIEPGYNYTWTDEDLYGSYFPIANALANLLQGAVRGYLSGILSYRTRVSETAIFSALKTAPEGAEANDVGLAPSLLTDEIKALARNKTVGELIEELSRNITLSLFSADKVRSANDTVTNVLISTNLNVYSYNRLVLIVTYAVTFVVALVGVLAGILSYRSNGVSHNTSFSAFMASTRNRTLDRITEGQSLGAAPLSWELSETKLRFGLLMSGDTKTLIGGPDPAGIPLRRAAFGLEEEIMPLRKGTPCY